MTGQAIVDAEATLLHPNVAGATAAAGHLQGAGAATAGQLPFP